MSNATNASDYPDYPDSPEYPDYTLGPLPPLDPLHPLNPFTTPKPFTHQISPIVWLAIIIHTMVFILGIPGNGLVVWVTKFEMKRTVNSVWFLNLAVADLLCCLSSPISIMNLALGYWPLGLFMCKFIPSILLVNMFASVLLLTVISIDRCALVLKPVWCQNNRTVCKAYVACAVVWILALVLSSPSFVYRVTTQLTNETQRCSSSTSQEVENAVAISRFLLGFFIPFVIITVCYSVLMRRVSGRFNRSRKTLKVVLVVIIGFFVCWLPYHVAGLILAANPPTSALFRSTMRVDTVLVAIAFTNSCINPIIYVLVGQEFKTKFTRSFRFIVKNVLAEESSQAVDSKRTKSTKSTNETRNTEALV